MINAEWQLSGNMADRYEEFLVPVIFDPWARNLLTRADLKPGHRLLDLACGTGIVARLAAKEGVSVVGGDINTGMLAVAADRAEGLHVVFRHADAQALPFEDRSFDALICQQGLQFFPDKQVAISECFRVLRPGGRAVFCTARDLDENPLMRSQVAAFGSHLGDDTTMAIRAVCSLTDPDEMRALFERAGFSPVKIEKVVLDLVASDGRAFIDGMMKSTPVADRIAAMEHLARDALREAVLQEFGACYDGVALQFPHSANVAIASRPV
jgi:ubiquinone/menaquinone biosynthesis C-methylase UbiE